MTFQERIDSDLKEAMKARDAERLGVIRMITSAIKQREDANRTESMEFLQPVRADLESAGVEGDLARTKVRFLAEFRTRTKDAAGEAVDDRRTAEVWTFERLFTSRDPKWLLTRVDAAEA